MKKLDQRIVDQELTDEFISEFRESIEDTIHHILLLEKNPENTESARSLFRNFHNIKGNASVLGFEKIVRISHEAENLLENIQGKTLQFNPQIIETMLISTDVLTALVDEVAGGTSFDEPKLNDFINTISSYLPPGAPDNASLALNAKEVPSLRILIVDDEFVSRSKAQKIMSQYGECESATGGTEALEAFNFAHEEGNPYDLITMDISMPDMDGVEALKRIRAWEESQNTQIGKGVKVIMVTASKTSNSVLSSFNEGCEAYIVKPFKKENLLAALKELGLVKG